VSGSAGYKLLKRVLVAVVALACWQLSLGSSPAIARECAGTAPGILARELLELDLSGLRHPSRSACLDASRFHLVEVFHDPIQDLSGSSFEVLEEGDRVEIVSVSATDSVGGYRATFRIQRQARGPKRAHEELGSLDLLIHSSKKRQERDGCAQLISPPKPWRIWRRCVPQ
jgi:hypothetical protein